MWDSLIIGSGPAGLGAAIYGKRAGLSVLVAEKEYMGTGQIAESGQVDNYLGLVGKNGYDLGEIFLEDAKKLGVEFYEGEAVAFEKKENSWSVSCKERDSDRNIKNLKQTFKRQDLLCQSACL